MKFKTKQAIIRKAVHTLGIKVRSLEIPADTDTVGNVYINGEFFGVFDYIRRTFVD